MTRISQYSSNQNGHKCIPIQETVDNRTNKENAKCTAEVELHTMFHNKNNLNKEISTTERVKPVVEQMSPS